MQSKQYGTQSKTMSDLAQTSQNAKATFASEFGKPVHAVIDGEPVRLTHVGNVEGMSPSYLVVDTSGKSFWVPTQRVTIIDPDYLPTSVEALKGIRDALIGSADQSSSR